jgi:Ras-related protein Rab-11A
MYDVTKPSSFSNLKAWVEELHKHASPHIVVILIGNKTDLESLRLVPAEAAETFAGVFPFPPLVSPLSFAIWIRNGAAENVRRFLVGCHFFCSAENGMMYMETSAFNASNVEFAFKSVLTQIYHMETGKHIEPSSSPSGRPLKMIERHFDI